MAYSEVKAAKPNPGRVVGTWDGGNESSTAMLVQRGHTVNINMNWTSGTYQIQSSPVGSNQYMPMLYNGAYDIGADAAIGFTAPATCLLRITGATLVGVAVIDRA